VDRGTKGKISGTGQSQEKLRWNHRPVESIIEFALPDDIDDTLAGGGIRLGYNITDKLSVEGEGNIFKLLSDPEGRRSKRLFGIKWGKRNENAGLCAKARPGFMRFDPNFS
jgi:hypothetical protein